MVISHLTQTSSSSHHINQLSKNTLHEDLGNPASRARVLLLPPTTHDTIAFIPHSTRHDLPDQKSCTADEIGRVLARMIESKSGGGSRNNEALAITFRHFHISLSNDYDRNHTKE